MAKSKIDHETTQRLRTLKMETVGQGAFLVRIHPVVLGEGVIALAEGSTDIGRDKDCSIAMDDQDVSRRHARIDYNRGQYLITDLGSTNGTSVNDKKISSEKLQSGDMIRVGKTIFKFLRGGNVEMQYHETVYSMMVSDGLTGIANKRYFLETLQRELSRSQRHKRPLSLVVFDLDHFKQINDKYGHLAGDVVLRETCTRVRKTVRRDELLARYGGEEFVVLLPESTLEEATQFAERIRELIAAEPIFANDTKIPVTASLGVAHTQGETTISGNEFFGIADRKLYEAKAAGRNRVVG